MNRKIKIAYCLPSLYIPGGMERVLTIKANYFAEVLGYDISLILTDGKSEKPFYELSPKVNLVYLDVNFNELWNQPLYKKVGIYLMKQRIYRKRLKECLLDIRPDITVSMLRREINFINSIADGSIKIGEIHINKSNFRDFSEGGKVQWLKKLIAGVWMWQLNRQLRQLTKFVILTEEDRQNFSYLQNTTVIANPLPFYPDRVSDCMGKEVIAVGRYSYEKGFDRLIEAWRMVTAKHPDWNLRIFGGGNREEYLALKEKYQLNSLYVEGQTPDIVTQYSKSSILALPSRFEGFGMVIVEAMACGVPSVSFACPCGPRNIICDPKDGLLVENGNIAQLAEKICYLIENESIRREMGKQARMSAERFRIENIGKQWEQLFNQLLKQ